MNDTLYLYNSLTRQKEILQPVEPGHVRLYVCGMTVYDYCHVGHARVMVVFDMLVRYLRASGYRVTYIRNITDIDDKIINRAQENGESTTQLTTRFIQAMHEDMAMLNVLPADLEPCATQSIDAMVSMISRLVNNNYAYQSENGDVYYAVRQFSDYGKLSGKKLEDLQAGARVEVEEMKRDPLDFVLWKAAKACEPSWPSPWGNGRPGWHIECSAMSTTHLGNHFDIHGGGMDLQFPHHENEIAQSEAATGEKFVNIWLHNGFVKVNEEKMSKSLGNFFTLRDVLAQYPAEVIRYFIIASHYRSPLNYADTQLDAAQQALIRLYTALRGLPQQDADIPADNPYQAQFMAAMNDDMNTPEAVAVLFDLARDINTVRSADKAQAASLANVLRSLGGILGLLQADPETFLQAETAGDTGLSAEAIEQLIVDRKHARTERNWAEADRIRDYLKDNQVILEDTAGKTTWRRG